VQIPTKNPVIVGDGAKRLEGTLTILARSVGIAYLSQSTHCHLSGKRESLSYLGVAQLLECKLAEGPVIPGYLGDVIGCCVSNSKGAHQSFGLLRGGLQLQLRSQLHVLKIHEKELFSITKIGSRRFFSMLKGKVSLVVSW
jgi:hypothetical protein